VKLWSLRACLVTAKMACVAVVAGCAPSPPSSSGPAAPTTAPSLPTKPVTLHILDVAGDLTTSKPVIENYVKAHPALISKVEYESGSATDVAGKLQAQQGAGRVDIDLVLTGTGALAQMSNQNELTKIWPNYKSDLPDLDAVLTPGGAKLQQTANGYGVIVEGGGGGGPIFEYNKTKVSSVPGDPNALLAWAKAHPGKFIYANPTSGSGPANALLDALPYQLGDKDPSDPVKGWDKTWAWLQQMNKYVSSYPSGTGDTFKGMAAGTYDLAPAQTGWDVLEHQPGGSLNDNFGVGIFDNATLITDGHFGAIPKGVPADHIAVDLDLLKWTLRPDQQALEYPTFSQFPVKGVSVSMAPAAAQAAVKKYGRPDFVKQISSLPVQLPLGATQVQQMYDKWNTLIGSKK
jgi:putative spermidine/putrescine transport system substrate-binding protein